MVHCLKTDLHIRLIYHQTDERTYNLAMLAYQLVNTIRYMLNSVNLTLLDFSSYYHNVDGAVLVLFSLAVAAAETAVGLAIIIAIFRNTLFVDINDINLLRW